MKKNIFTSSLVAFFFAVVFLSSCSQFGNLDIEKRHYNKGFYVHHNEKPKAAATEEKTVALASFETPAQAQQPSEAPAATQAPAEQQQAPAAVQQQPAAASHHAARHTATEKAADRSAVEAPMKADAPAAVSKERHDAPAAGGGDTTLILLVLLAILLPPLAVFLKEGSITKNFWIDLILCLLFYLPGIIFALLVVFDVI